MVLYDYATIYLWQANACTERRRSLHFWAWRESIACLRTYIQENLDHFRGTWNLCGICSSIDTSPHPPYGRLRTDRSWRSPRIKKRSGRAVSNQTWRDAPWEDGHLVLWEGVGGGDGNKKLAWLYGAIFPFLSVFPLSLDKHSRTPEIFTTLWSLLRNERPEPKDCTGPDRAKL